MSVGEMSEALQVKESALFDGPIENCYDEDDEVRLMNGTVIPVGRFQEMNELPEVLCEQDLAKLKCGRILKDPVPKERCFFVNRSHLVILDRGEMNNGRWVSRVMGVWKINEK